MKPKNKLQSDPSTIHPKSLPFLIDITQETYCFHNDFTSLNLFIFEKTKNTDGKTGEHTFKPKATMSDESTKKCLHRTMERDNVLTAQPRLNYLK